jgi:hypothetical protein
MAGVSRHTTWLYAATTYCSLACPTARDGQYAPADVPSVPRDLPLKDERRWRGFASCGLFFAEALFWTCFFGSLACGFFDSICAKLNRICSLDREPSAAQSGRCSGTTANRSGDPSRDRTNNSQRPSTRAECLDLSKTATDAGASQKIIAGVRNPKALFCYVPNVSSLLNNEGGPDGQTPLKAPPFDRSCRTG